jgi:hypothetical protein
MFYILTFDILLLAFTNRKRSARRTTMHMADEKNFHIVIPPGLLNMLSDSCSRKKNTAYKAPHLHPISCLKMTMKNKEKCRNNTRKHKRKSFKTDSNQTA